MPTDQDFRDLESGLWAEPWSETCPCRGSGWLLSDFDTWHRCPVHGRGVPHPEEYPEDHEVEDYGPSLGKAMAVSYGEIPAGKGFGPPLDPDDDLPF